MSHFIKKPTIILLFFVVQDAFSQNLLDITFNEDFSAQVKSIDEFICRFNGTESKPGIVKGSQWKRDNLLSLFNFQMSHGGLPDADFRLLLTEFVSSAIQNETKLKITDAEMWAEVCTSATINGKKARIHLVLQSETYKDSLVRWAIVSVSGLAKAGIIDTTHFYAISPVEHEVHFMSIDGIFQYSRPEIMGYRGKKVSIDELSVFFTLSMLGKVKINMVDNVTIHCLEVPGFAFTINEYGRKGYNSGWLISSVKKINKNEKKKYITKLIGI